MFGHYCFSRRKINRIFIIFRREESKCLRRRSFLLVINQRRKNGNKKNPLDERLKKKGNMMINFDAFFFLFILFVTSFLFFLSNHIFSHLVLDDAFSSSFSAKKEKISRGNKKSAIHCCRSVIAISLSFSSPLCYFSSPSK